MSEPVPAVPVISYAMPDAHIRFRWLLRIAQFTGWTPLCVGVATLLLWILTRSAFFMGVGVWTIVCGFFATAAGCICLLIYFFTNRLRDPAQRRTVNRQFFWTLILLIVNYPAAYLCILAAISFDHH